MCGRKQKRQATPLKTQIKNSKTAKPLTKAALNKKIDDKEPEGAKIVHKGTMVNGAIVD